MKLTALLLKTKLPRGHLFRGKYRLVAKVTPLDAAKLRADYEREEQNMLYLRHPYITVEEDRGHTKALGKKEEKALAFKTKMLQWKRKNVTIEERLRHLRVTDCWD